MKPTNGASTGKDKDQTKNTTTHRHTRVKGPELSQDCPKKVRGGNKGWPKTDYRHWLPRMEIRPGRSYYETRFCRSGKIRRLSFQTRSKEEAARQSADMWSLIEKLGWEAAFNQVRPPVEAKAGTVGAVITAATGLSMARPSSLHAYALALRGIVAGVTGRRNDDAVRLDAITPTAVKVWRNNYIKERGTNPAARAKAIITTNSLIRNAKALFARKHLEDLRKLVNLPAVLPLDGVRLETAPSGRYQSKIDPNALILKAKEELAVEYPETFKLFVLCLALGLRRSEADRLVWDDFDFQNRKLHLAVSEHGDLKSMDSAGVIDLDQGTAALLQGYRAKGGGLFVLEDDNPPLRPNKAKAGQVVKVQKRAPYRAKKAGQHLISWLRQHGVTGSKPIHTLRKEVGSVIATKHGLLAAQRFLRHSTPTITAAIYADVKKAVVPGFGRVLGG